MMNFEDWVAMKADPSEMINVRTIIDHLTGRKTLILTPDQWADMQEHIADLLEQFLEMRKTQG
jgi:hypothetical protein